MSSRKKRRTYKLEREYHPPVVTMVRYSNPGVLRDLPTDKLTSGLAYQRPVELKAVEELIRDCWSRLTSASAAASTMFWMGSTV